MLSDCTICTEMYGNGARIGTESTQRRPKPILKERQKAVCVYCAAVRGKTARTTPALRFAWQSSPHFITRTPAFASQPGCADIRAVRKTKTERPSTNLACWAAKGCLGYDCSGFQSATRL